MGAGGGGGGDGGGGWGEWGGGQGNGDGITDRVCVCNWFRVGFFFLFSCSAPLEGGGGKIYILRRYER